MSFYENHSKDGINLAQGKKMIPIRQRNPIAALTLGAVAVVLLPFCASTAQGDATISIGSKRELFVDTHLIQTMSGVRLQLHAPTPKEIVMHHDKLWEGNGCNYYSIFRDGDIYRMYYDAWAHEPSTIPVHDVLIAYAESKDGKSWVRPDLGLFEFNGSKKNNIVWASPKLDNWGAFKDTNPGCPADARYKAFYNGNGGLMAAKSADGIHWSRITEEPVLTDGAFDSHNLAFWDAEQGHYRAYYRDFRMPDGSSGSTLMSRSGGIRDIKTATSDDFTHWTPGEWLEYPGAPDEQLYTNNVIPYYRAPHIYLGFPARYLDRGWSDAMRALPELAEREARASLKTRYGTALTDGLFMSSRDGRVFHRWLEAFIRPGLRYTDNWVYSDNYQNWGLIETKSDLPGAPDEISIYAPEHYWRGAYTNLRRFTLRVDGFVSVNAPGKGGEFTTRLLSFSGKALEMNFSTSIAGSVRVEIQDATGSPIPGYTLADCPEIFGDHLERVVAWKGGTDVGGLAGKPIRLSFVMKDADLYSMRFRP